MEKIIKNWKENAEQYEADNFLFIRSLKMKDEHKVDRMAKRLHREAFEKIDCLKCGNCCKISKPVLHIDDIERIAKHFETDVEDIKTRYLEQDEDMDWTFNGLPCPFLGIDISCQIYASRPKDCQEFPHTDKKQFASRSYQHSANTVVCPAVYYIVERMQGFIR